MKGKYLTKNDALAENWCNQIDGPNQYGDLRHDQHGQQRTSRFSHWGNGRKYREEIQHTVLGNRHEESRSSCKARNNSIKRWTFYLTTRVIQISNFNF